MVMVKTLSATTMASRFLKRFLLVLCFVFIALCFALCICICKERVVFSPSASVERGFYLVLDSNIEEGKLVLFDCPLKEKTTYIVDGKTYILCPSDMPKQLIKKVQKIEKDRMWVVGNSPEEIKKRGETGVSFDSVFFGWCSTFGAKRLVYLPLLSKILGC